MFIVTGGAGFIGSAMIWKLNTLGIDEIIAVDNLGDSEKWKNLVSLRYIDYMHQDAFLEAIRKDTLSHTIDCIFHLGACSSTTERNADFLMHNNLEYTKTLCRYACERGCRFINASSAATYGDGSNGFDDETDLQVFRPLNMYAYSKHLFDLWAQRTTLLPEIVSLKFFNVYGPNEYHKGQMRSVVNKHFETIKHNGKVQLFCSNHEDYADGCQQRDFIYIKDCVDVMWWLYKHRNTNGIFNLGTGVARTWLDLSRAVFNAMDQAVKIEFIPIPEHIADKYQNFTQAKMSRLRKAGYEATFSSLEEGITDYVRNYLGSRWPYLQLMEN